MQDLGSSWIHCRSLHYRPMAQEQPTHETASGSEKNIWTVIKDNAALVTAVLALFWGLDCWSL